MTKRRIDSAASSIAVRTKAKGLLSRLAHDLEIAAERFTGDVELDGDSWSAELSFPVRDLRVVGTVRGDRVDRTALSSDDCAEIERRLRSDVLPVAAVAVSVSGGARQGEARVRVRREQRVRFTLAGDDVLSGELTLSLSALGIAEIKGPLGAFKVSDAVAIRFRLRLEPG